MSRRATRLAALAGALAAAPPAWPQQQPGTPIEQVELATLEGTPAALLGTGELASIVVFFRPDQEHSSAGLKMIARCERELAGKPVHWAAVVSERAPRPRVEALVQEAGIAMPVLVDAGDRLHRTFGIVMHPAIVIADREHRLAAFAPFRKINYCHEVRAHVRRLLGEISEEDLAAALDPAASRVGGEQSKAVREVRMGQRHLEAGSFDKALTAGRKALEHDPRRADAHALIGAALAGKGDCKGARAEFKLALELDPADAAALQGAKGCGR